MDESNVEEGRLNSILKSRNRFPLHEVQGFFPEDDTVTTTFTRNRRVSFGRKCVKEFQIGSAVSTQALDEYEQSASFSDPSECSGPLDLALNKTCRDPEIEESKDLITPPECFSDSKPRAPEDRARLFTENCISIAKSVFQDTETELTAIIIGAKPTNTDEERKNMSNVNFSTLDMSHDFLPVRHPEFMFSEQSHPVDKSRYEFLDHPTSSKLGMKTPRPVTRTPLARISTPWDGENDENIPPAHRPYRQASTPIHRDYISEPTMEFTCANMKASRQQIIHNESDNYGSDMEETCGRKLVNNTLHSLDMSCTRGAWNNVYDEDDEDDEDEDPLKLDAPRDEFLADLSGLDNDKTITPSDTEDSPFCSIQKELANLSVANKSFRDRYELSASNRTTVLSSPAPASPQVLSPCADPLLFTPTCSNIRLSHDDMEMTESRPTSAQTPVGLGDVSTVLTPCALPFSPTCVNMQLKSCENDMEMTEAGQRPVNLSDDSLLASSLVISPNGPITPLQFSPTCPNIKFLTPGLKDEGNNDMNITTNKILQVNASNLSDLKDSGLAPLCFAPTPMRKSKISPSKELNFVIIESSHESSEPSKIIESSSNNQLEIESLELAPSQQDEIIPTCEVDMDITQINHTKCSEIADEMLLENSKIISERVEEGKECELDVSQVNHTKCSVDNEDKIASEPEVSHCLEISVDDNTKISEANKESEMDITQVNHSEEVEISGENLQENAKTVQINSDHSDNANIDDIIPINPINSDIATQPNVECHKTYKDTKCTMEINQMSISKDHDILPEVSEKYLPEIENDHVTDSKVTFESNEISEVNKKTENVTNSKSNSDECNVVESLDESLHKIVKTPEENDKFTPKKSHIGIVTDCDLETKQPDKEVDTEQIEAVNSVSKINFKVSEGNNAMEITLINHSELSEIIDKVVDGTISNTEERLADDENKVPIKLTEAVQEERIDLERSQLNHMNEPENSEKEQDILALEIDTLNKSDVSKHSHPTLNKEEPSVVVENAVQDLKTVNNVEQNKPDILEEVCNVASLDNVGTNNVKVDQTNEVLGDDMEITMANCENEIITPSTSENIPGVPIICDYKNTADNSEPTQTVISCENSDVNKETLAEESLVTIPNILIDSKLEISTQSSLKDAASSNEDCRKSLADDDNKDLEIGIQRLDITGPNENTHGDSEETYTLKSNCEKTYTVELNDETRVLENSHKNKRQTYVIPEKRPHSDSPCPNERLKKNRLSDSPMPLRRSARLDGSLNRSKTETKQLSTPKSLKKDVFGKRIHSESPLVGDGSLKKGRSTASPLITRNLLTLLDNDVSYAGPTRFSANLETSITLQEFSIGNDSEKELSINTSETDNVVSSTMNKYANSPEIPESVAENILTPERRRNSNISFGVFPLDPPIVMNKSSFVIEEDIPNEVALTMKTFRENSITVPNLAIPCLDDEDFGFEHDISSSTKKIDDLLKKSMVLNETQTGDVNSTNMSIIDEILRLPHSIDFPSISNINSTRNVSVTQINEDSEKLEMEGVETELFEQTYKNVRAILEEQSKTINCNWKIIQLQTGQDNAISIEFPLLEAGLILQIIFDKSSKIISLKTSENPAHYYQTKIKKDINTFGFNFLKNLIKNQEEKLKCLEELPMFIDLFSGFAKKLVEAMEDALTVLKGCASAILCEHTLSFRLNYYTPLTSCLVNVDLNELAMLGQPSINLRHEMGRMSEQSVRQLMPNPQRNLLQVFVRAATNYTIDLEAKTGFVTKRPQLLF